MIKRMVTNAEMKKPFLKPLIRTQYYVNRIIIKKILMLRIEQTVENVS